MARKKIPVGLALDPELLAELDQYIAAQDAKPSRTAVIEGALRKLLDAHNAD